MTKRMTLKQIFSLVLIFIMGLALISGLILLRQRIVRPKATANPVLSFTAPDVSVQQNFTLMAQVNPNGTSFNAYTLVFTFDADKIGLQETNPDLLINNIEWGDYSSLNAKQVALNGNKFTITDATGDLFSGTTPINLVKVKLRAKNVSGKATFTWDTSVTKLAGSGTYISYNSSPKDITISDASGAKLYFDSEKKPPVTNDSLPVSIYLDTNSSSVSSLQIKFVYDNKLGLLYTSGDLNRNIDLNTSSGFNTSGSGVWITVDQTARTVFIGLTSGSPVTGNNIKLATVQLKTGTSTGDISFQADQASSKVYNISDVNILTDRPAYTLTIQLVGAATQTPTVPPPNATATVTPTVPAIPPTATPTGIPPTVTVTPTVTPTVTTRPINTPTATPPANDDQYKIEIGDKNTLTIQIAPGIDPQIAFKFKLAKVETTPDLYVKLRVKDDLYFVDHPGALAGTCNTPSIGDKDFIIPVRAEGGVYRPTAQINGTPPAGVVPPISAEGVVTLTGVVPARYYSLILKGPKTRGSKMVSHVILNSGNTNPVFYWDNDNQALEPGDLPDPNYNGAQDCTVNSIDLSLISALLPSVGSSTSYVCCNSSCNRAYDSSCPDWSKMIYADVNYDGVVNGADISKVVDTLSRKPDDDL